LSYLLDTNVFIQAKNLHYGFDFCPAFWDWLDQKHASGDVRSISLVGDELMNGTDTLADWAKARKKTLFPEPDAASLGALTQVSVWARSGKFDASAINTFLQIADSLLVAGGLAIGATVVTHEIPSGGRKIKIPTACLELGVPYCTPFQMLRRENASFVLGKSDT
jgi:hypothetical protein